MTVECVASHIDANADIGLSTSALKAAAFHLGKSCKVVNNEFMLCRHETADPRKCIQEGFAVSNCARDFLKKIKLSCSDEFAVYSHCLDKSSSAFGFEMCRKSQGMFDKCLKDNFDIDRPRFGDLAKVQIHHTDRQSIVNHQTKYRVESPNLPQTYPRIPAKFGSRFQWLE